MGITERTTSIYYAQPDRASGGALPSPHIVEKPIGALTDEELSEQLATYHLSFNTNYSEHSENWRKAARGALARARKQPKESPLVDGGNEENIPLAIRAEFAKIADPFKGTIARNEIMVFQNGHEPYQPMRTTEGKALVGEICTDVLQQMCGNYFTEQGKVKEEAKAEWQNIQEIVPSLAEIFFDRGSDIRLLPQEQIADTLKYCIGVAKNPQILGDTVITTGIGGTIDDFSSSRLPVYIAPALRMADKLRLFYEKRDAAYQHEGKIRKFTTELSQSHIAEHGSRMDFQEVKRIQQELRESQEAELPELTAEETAAIRTRFGIATTYPIVRAFTAKETAIMCNYPHHADTVRTRAAEAEGIFCEFQQQYFPHVQMEFLTDTPEKELTPTQRATDRYLTHELRQLIRTNPNFAQTVLRLETQGGRRGEHASEHVDDYVQRHVTLFGDPLDLPKEVTTILREVQSTPDGHNTTPRTRADHTIMIGGEPEGPFWKLRRELTAKASAESYIAFLQTDMQDILTNPARREEQKDIPELRSLAGKLAAWDAEKDARNVKNTNISVLTAVKLVPYFVDQLCDQPYGIDLEKSIEELEFRQDEVQALTTDDPKKIEEAREQRSRRRSIIRDLRFLLRTQNEQFTA